MQCIYNAYDKSGFEIATNTVKFGTEFFPFVIKIYEESPICDITAFTIEIKGLAVGILPQLLQK